MISGVPPPPFPKASDDPRWTPLRPSGGSPSLPPATQPGHSRPRRWGSIARRGRRAPRFHNGDPSRRQPSLPCPGLRLIRFPLVASQAGRRRARGIPAASLLSLPAALWARRGCPQTPSESGQPFSFFHGVPGMQAGRCFLVFPACGRVADWTLPRGAWEPFTEINAYR